MAGLFYYTVLRKKHIYIQLVKHLEPTHTSYFMQLSYLLPTYAMEGIHDGELQAIVTLQSTCSTFFFYLCKNIYPPNLRQQNTAMYLNVCISLERIIRSLARSQAE